MSFSDEFNSIIGGSLFGAVRVLAKIDARSLEGCEVYKPRALLKRLRHPYCRYKVNIDELIRYDPKIQEMDIWLRADIDAIRDWLKENCIGNYKLIIVPSDPAMPGYSHFKENRIYFSSSEDAMAFKLKHL